MRTIAVINQKGGVGKTTTVANLGAGLADRGPQTCLIDLDPQAHLTLHFGIEPGTPDKSAYDVMIRETPAAEAAVRIEPNLWVVPSVIDLAAAEVELVSTVGREQILHDRLCEGSVPWKLTMIDCPPSLGLLTLNALAAADDLVIPLQPHFLALQGLGKLLETAALVQRRINPRLRVAGVILCMYESNTRLAGEVFADLKNFFEAARGKGMPWSDTRIFKTVIRRNVKLAECPSYGRTIFQYDPASNGAADYNALADEFLTSLGLPGEPAAASGQAAAKPDAPTVAPAEAPTVRIGDPPEPGETTPNSPRAHEAPLESSEPQEPAQSPVEPAKTPQPTPAQSAGHAPLQPLPPALPGLQPPQPIVLSAAMTDPKCPPSGQGGDPAPGSPERSPPDPQTPAHPTTAEGSGQL